MEIQKKKLLVSLEDQIQNQFSQYKYEDGGLNPSIFFMKELVNISRETPIVNIPDTLIINEKQAPLLWIYTNKEGRLEKTSNVSFKDYVHKITSYCSPNQLTATVKKATMKQGDNNFGNDVRLVNSRFLNNMSVQYFGDKVGCIQKYVKSHGKNSFVCRTVLASSPHCFMITNKASYYDEKVPEAKRFLVSCSQNNMNKLNITKSYHGKNLNQTLVYLQDIARYFRFLRGVTFKELTGDFIKDQCGNWWLYNIKAFIIEQQIRKHSLVPASNSRENIKEEQKELEKQRYQKTKICKYCEKLVLQSDLKHKMTRRMIIEVDRYLLHLGKEFKWLKRSDNSVDSHCLYQEHKICQRCYHLYTEIRQLMTIEDKLLKKLGFQFEKKTKELLMNQTNTEDLELQSKNKQIVNLMHQIPQKICLGPNSNIIVRDNYPFRNDQIINQMVRYRFIIYLHEIDEVNAIRPNHNYYLEFSLFGIKHKFKIQANQNSTLISLKKLKIGYFFTYIDKDNSQTYLQKYINKNQYFKINMIVENKSTHQRQNIGNLKIEMKDLFGKGTISKKPFYKFFNISEVNYGWGLEGSIGLSHTPYEVNTSRTILSTEDKLVYLPSQNYYFCEPLPEEWIQEIYHRNTIRRKIVTPLASTQLIKSEVPLQSSQQYDIVVKQADTNCSFKTDLLKEIQIYQRKGSKAQNKKSRISYK